jgi:uncharacterized protein (DUF433 family)
MSIQAGLIDIGSFIDQREGYRGGRPFVVGTGVTVDRISVLYSVDKFGAQEIADELRLTLPQVHAALAFYLANKDQIDSELREYDAETDRLAEQYYREHGRRIQR